MRAPVHASHREERHRGTWPRYALEAVYNAGRGASPAVDDTFTAMASRYTDPCLASLIPHWTATFSNPTLICSSAFLFYFLLMVCRPKILLMGEPGTSASSRLAWQVCCVLDLVGLPVCNALLGRCGVCLIWVHDMQRFGRFSVHFCLVLALKFRNVSNICDAYMDKIH